MVCTEHDHDVRGEDGPPPSLEREANVTSTERQSGGHHIVVGIDGSVSSIAALDWAVHQAEMTGYSLKVVTTWDWPAAYGMAFAYVPSDYSPSADAQKILDSALEKVRREHPGVTIESLVAEGHPAPILVEESRGADLLVVGSRGHGEFSGMLLGSVSEHCVTNAYCPVVVTRDRG
jgi:nucleotide-binding universal stress UspA family protein